MVDKVLTLPCEKIGKAVGRLDDDFMVRITLALAMWLAIA